MNRIHVEFPPGILGWRVLEKAAGKSKSWCRGQRELRIKVAEKKRKKEGGMLIIGKHGAIFGEGKSLRDM